MAGSQKEEHKIKWEDIPINREESMQETLF